MQEKMNIVLSMNSNYVMPSLVCMISILENNKSPIDFYILYSHLEQSEIDFLKLSLKKFSANNSLIPIKIDESSFADSPAPGRSREAYFRLLIPKVLPSNVERCLYVDSDVLVQGSIATLYKSDFEGYAMIACQDMGEFLFFHKERHDLLGIPFRYEYFNSGVLLFNLDYFRNSFDVSHFVDYIKENPEKLKFLDQDVLNALLYDKTKLVNSTLYNYMEILVNPLVSNDAMSKAVIVHFLQKPWNYTYNGMNSGYWWKYARRIYGFEYMKFTILNFIYRKLLGIILLVVSVQTLKKIKR